MVQFLFVHFVTWHYAPVVGGVPVLSLTTLPLVLLARHRIDDIYKHGDVMRVTEPHVDAFLIDLDRAIEHRRCGSGLIGPLFDHVEIVEEQPCRALHGLEPPLRHPGRANSELRRAAAARGDRLDHQINIDTGLEPKRHRLGSRRAVDRNQQVVYELDLGRGTEWTEVDTHVGEALDDGFHLLGGFCVASEKDHCLARQHHTWRAADLAVEVGGALLSKRSDMLFLVGNRMRAELYDDLSGTRRVD